MYKIEYKNSNFEELQGFTVKNERLETVVNDLEKSEFITDIRFYEMRETNIYTLPEYILPYIINGDMDNLTDKEVEEINEFIQSLNKPLFGNFSERFFTHYNDFNNIGATCVEIEISETIEE